MITFEDNKKSDYEIEENDSYEIKREEEYGTCY